MGPLKRAPERVVATELATLADVGLAGAGPVQLVLEAPADARGAGLARLAHGGASPKLSRPEAQPMVS